MTDAQIGAQRRTARDQHGDQHGDQPGRPDDPVRLVALLDEPLDVEAVRTAVADPAAGGICVFVGAVRDHDGGKAVSALGYSAHPTAIAQMRDLARSVAARHEARAVAVVHRVGDLAVGDLAVVAAVATGHRGDAFEACHAPDRRAEGNGANLEAPGVRRRKRRVGGHSLTARLRIGSATAT